MDNSLLIQLIKKSIFLTKEKKGWLLENMYKMNNFQKQDLINLLQSSKNEILLSLQKVKNIKDPKFWQKYKEFKKKRIGEMYKTEEMNENKEESLELLLNKII